MHEIEFIKNCNWNKKNEQFSEFTIDKFSIDN